MKLDICVRGADGMLLYLGCVDTRKLKKGEKLEFKLPYEISYETTILVSVPRT